jgi:hypothetical protein
VDATVVVTCTATDALSGPASAPCAGLSAPAATFPAGASTVTRTATDVAGNVGSGSATVTVHPTAGGLCRLTRQLVTTSGSYPAAGPKRTAVTAALAAACASLTVRSTGSVAQKRLALAAYQLALGALRSRSLLTSGQQAALTGFARAL